MVKKEENNMKRFINYILEAKLEAGGEDLGKLFGPKGKFSPKSKDAPKEGTAFQRTVQAGRMGVGDFAKMVKGIFGPPSGDVKEPETKSNADLLRDKLRAAGKEMKKKDVTPDIQKKIDAVKGMRGNDKKKKDGIVEKISSFFDNTAEGARGNLPKNIAASLNDHLARLHAGFFSDNNRRPTQQEATKMAHEVVDDHFAGVQRRLKKAKFTSKSGKPVKITHFESTRESPHGFYDRRNDDSGPMPDGRHLIVHFDHHHTGEYNINMDHIHAQHIAKQLKATTGHDWFHVPYSEGVKIRGKKVVFRGNKSSPMLFTTGMTHRDIDLGDGDHDGDGGDDNGGPDEPMPIVPRGPRGKKPQLV